jgi:flagellar biosynthetic protein FliP
VTPGAVVQAIGALVATLALLVLSLRVMRRLQSREGGNAGDVPLRVLRRVPLGPKQGVALLQVGARVLVVSVTDSGTALLTELDPADADRALPGGVAPEADPGVVAPGRRSREGWASILRRVGRAGLGLLLVAALTASARTGAAQTETTPVPPASPASAASVQAPTASPAPSSTAAKRGALRPAGMTAPAPAARPAAPPAALSGSGLSVRGPVAPKVDLKIGSGTDAIHLDGTVGIVVFLGALTLLPAIFLLMTSFTRILIVLHFLRSALGTQTTPPNQLLVALAILLTGVVMNPVLQRANQEALQPYFAGQISQAEAYSRGVTPLRTFMLENTREQELALFADLSNAQADSVEALPTVTIVSAFVTSELRTAFQMGFVIYLPFIVLDLVVASVLMSLGMFMVPPMMVSLPFKLLLFVLADGWTLTVQNLVTSFR